jgi:hypothetical protein
VSLRSPILVIGAFLAVFAAGPAPSTAPARPGSGTPRIGPQHASQTPSAQRPEAIRADRPDLGLIEPGDPEPEGDAAVGMAPDPLPRTPRPGPAAGRRAPRPDRHVPPGSTRLRC